MNLIHQRFPCPQIDKTAQKIRMNQMGMDHIRFFLANHPEKRQQPPRSLFHHIQVNHFCTAGGQPFRYGATFLRRLRHQGDYRHIVGTAAQLARQLQHDFLRSPRSQFRQYHQKFHKKDRKKNKKGKHPRNGCFPSNEKSVHQKRKFTNGKKGTDESLMKFKSPIWNDLSFAMFTSPNWSPLAESA